MICPILAETSGKNAIVVTPSADVDLAVADLAKSAFGHAGQKCSAASLAILVGSVADSDRFKRQLVDAITTMKVGASTDPTTIVGPLIEPAQGKLLRALTTLDDGESWLIEPQQLDDEGRSWSPGVRRGVTAGSEFHTTEYFGPVLGIMRARDLDEAIALQNATSFGLTAGLHSLDVDEVDHWLEQAQAGNLYVNRGITGAIVRRQPFGGWKRSSVGGSTKAGGPSYVMGFGTWHPVAREPKQNLSVRGLHDGVRRLLEAAQPPSTSSASTPPALEPSATRRLGRRSSASAATPPSSEWSATCCATAAPTSPCGPPRVPPRSGSCACCLPPRGSEPACS